MTPLTDALTAADATVRCLQEALTDAGAVESLILLPLIERAATLRSDLHALASAAQQDSA